MNVSGEQLKSSMAEEIQNVNRYCNNGESVEMIDSWSYVHIAIVIFKK